MTLTAHYLVLHAQVMNMGRQTEAAPREKSGKTGRAGKEEEGSGLCPQPGMDPKGMAGVSFCGAPKSPAAAASLAGLSPFARAGRVVLLCLRAPVANLSPFS